jgi:hypothetical protein
VFDQRPASRRQSLDFANGPDVVCRNGGNSQKFVLRAAHWQGIWTGNDAPALPIPVLDQPGVAMLVIDRKESPDGPDVGRRDGRNAG